MPPIRSLLAGVAALAVAGCAQTTTMQEAGGTVAAPASADAVRLLPVRTENATARQELGMGLRAADMGHGAEARRHFMNAIQADASLAMAHLMYARNAQSIPVYREHLQHASQLAANATEAERLLIKIEEASFATDREAQLRFARQLVTVAPGNPRAWSELATVQAQMGRTEEARETLEAAARTAPDFAPLRVQLANTYLTIPRNVELAERHIREGIRLAPDEALMYDILGDVHRMQEDLPGARTAYLRAASLDPTRGLTFQQLGHVNSFLGNYAEARANYDSAIALETGNERAAYGIWRALVHIHEGKAPGAVRELAELSSRIDGMNIPNPLGVRINTEFNRFFVAQHVGMHDEASAAIETLRPLLTKLSDQANDDGFRRRSMANIAWAEGMLAARRGDYDAARASAKRIMELRDADRDPRRNEAAHQVLGHVAFAQGEYAKAADHLAQADETDTYVIFHRAMALEKLGRTEEARKLYRRVASTNFNSANLALVRADAMKKAG